MPRLSSHCPQRAVVLPDHNDSASGRSCRAVCELKHSTETTCCGDFICSLISDRPCQVVNRRAAIHRQASQNGVITRQNADSGSDRFDGYGQMEQVHTGASALSEQPLSSPLGMACAHEGDEVGRGAPCFMPFTTWW